MGATMDRLDAIRVFVRVVERGSFSAVAREFGTGQPVISKQISGLEEYLKAQLLVRTSRSLNLTEAGQAFYQSALRVIAELEAAEARVGIGQSEPSGLLRVSVAPAFGHLYIVPRLPALLSRYPQLTVELVATDRSVNLVEDGIDLAIRNGELSDSTLVARKIGSTSIVMVATPEYLQKHGEPRTPEDLKEHRGILFVSSGEVRSWAMRAGDESIVHRPGGQFRTNDAEQIRQAVLSGMGIAQSVDWLFEADIASGAVRCVLREFEPPAHPISAVRPSGRLTNKVAVFTEFVAELLKKPEPRTNANPPIDPAFPCDERPAGA
jgi:LysR family transcriptional regulator for bpeEF and oprC